MKSTLLNSIGALGLCLGLVCTLNFNAFAQGTAFTYQGRLESGGVPYTGLAEFQFSLWNAASAGSQLGSTLTLSGVGVTNGLFAVTLDFGNQFPGADRWLQIAVRTNASDSFTMLTPRQPLTATPYSVLAGNISGVLANSSLPASPAFSGTVAAGGFSGDGAGLTNLNAGQFTSGTLSDLRLSTNVALRAAHQTFSGTNRFTERVAFGTDVTDSRVTVRTGDADKGFRVTSGGIGNIVLQNLDGGNDGFQAINFNGYHSSGEQLYNVNKARWRIQVDQRGVDDVLRVDTYRSGSGGQILLTAQTNGNIGIGTPTPQTRLDVAGDVRFTSGGQTILSAQTNGDVGIGTPTPQARLDVAGAIRFTDVSGTARISGLLRSGSETGTADAPNPAGLIIRRINSFSSTAGSVVARVDDLTLTRDGTAGGFQLHYSQFATLSVACMGIDRTGAQRNFYRSMVPVSAGTLQIYSNAQDIVHFQCTFGNALSPGGHLAQVTLTRHSDGVNSSNRWVGTLVSTFNQ